MTKKLLILTQFPRERNQVNQVVFRMNSFEETNLESVFRRVAVSYVWCIIDLGGTQKLELYNYRAMNLQFMFNKLVHICKKRTRSFLIIYRPYHQWWQPKSSNQNPQMPLHRNTWQYTTENQPVNQSCRAIANPQLHVRNCTHTLDKISPHAEWPKSGQENQLSKDPALQVWGWNTAFQNHIQHNSPV